MCMNSRRPEQNKAMKIQTKDENTSCVSVLSSSYSAASVKRLPAEVSQ